MLLKLNSEGSPCCLKMEDLGLELGNEILITSPFSFCVWVLGWSCWKRNGPLGHPSPRIESSTLTFSLVITFSPRLSTSFY